MICLTETRQAELRGKRKSELRKGVAHRRKPPSPPIKESSFWEKIKKTANRDAEAFRNGGGSNRQGLVVHEGGRKTGPSPELAESVLNFLDAIPEMNRPSLANPQLKDALFSLGSLEAFDRVTDLAVGWFDDMTVAKRKPGALLTKLLIKAAHQVLNQDYHKTDYG